jgi:hypothetical protein
MEYDVKVDNSREFLQQVDFRGYPLIIEVRSAKDPHIIFGQESRGFFELDPSPGG